MEEQTMQAKYWKMNRYIQVKQLYNDAYKYMYETNQFYRFILVKQLMFNSRD